MDAFTKLAVSCTHKVDEGTQIYATNVFVGANCNGRGQEIHMSGRWVGFKRPFGMSEMSWASQMSDRVPSSTPYP